VTIAGAHGNLTIGRDGSYTYTGSSVGGDVFSYKIVDRDGDSFERNVDHHGGGY
jgi:VCBS repeat-containing protein